MAALTQIGTSNISLADVRDTLTSNGGMATNELKSFFQTSTNINKWSKFKPVHYPAAFLDSDLRWQGYGTCGFLSSSIIFSSDSALVTAYKNGTTFQYELPKGGSDSPYRLGDFRGYYPAAKAPIWDFYINGGFVSGSTSSSIDCELVSNNTDSTKELQISQILPAGTAAATDWFFGVIIVANGKYFKKSHASSLGASLTNRIFSVTYSEVANVCGTFSTFSAYPCLMSIANGTSGSFMALPCAAAGGEFASGGVSGSVTTQTASVGWVGNTYYYTGVGITFEGVLGYAESMEGQTAKVTIKVTHSDGSTNENSSSITLAKTEVTSTGSYRMDFSRQVAWSLQSGDEFTMTVTAGSSGISSSSTPTYGGTVVPE